MLVTAGAFAALMLHTNFSVSPRDTRMDHKTFQLLVWTAVTGPSAAMGFASTAVLIETAKWEGRTLGSKVGEFIFKLAFILLVPLSMIPIMMFVMLFVFIG